nr:MAG TPA: hypothetical protein [Caudoviricetes sp.]
MLPRYQRTQHFKPPIRKELINLSYQFLSENSRFFWRKTDGKTIKRRNK